MTLPLAHCRARAPGAVHPAPFMRPLGDLLEVRRLVVGEGHGCSMQVMSMHRSLPSESSFPRYVRGGAGPTSRAAARGRSASCMTPRTAGRRVPHAESARRRYSRRVGHRGRHIDPGATSGPVARQTGGSLRASPSDPARQPSRADGLGRGRLARLCLPSDRTSSKLRTRPPGTGAHEE